MTVTIDPADDPIAQVRLTIGDAETTYILDDVVIQYILDKHSNDITASSLEALRYIVSTLGKKVDEEVGDVKVKWSQLRAHYKQLLSDLLRDPSITLTPVLHFFGGTSKTEINRVRNNSDSNLPPLQEGEFTTVPKSSTRDDDNGFLLN